MTTIYPHKQVASTMVLTPPGNLTPWTTNSVNTSAHTHALKPQRGAFVYVEPQHPNGRMPKINLLLTDMALNTVRKVGDFAFIEGDRAIDVLGNYNPMYAGRPKKLAMLMLESAAGRAPWSSIAYAGLAYRMPKKTGIRKAGRRTSHAGLMLLDHWAQKFPPFAPFVMAYVSVKSRKEITADCFDLSMGAIPKWMLDDEKKEKDRLIKWEAREYRKEKKRKEAMAITKTQLDIYAQQTMLLNQQQSAQYYQAALNNSQQLYAPMSAQAQLQGGITYDMSRGCYVDKAGNKV